MALDAFKSSIMHTIADYDVIEKIAEGGMGTVYKAKHRLNGNIVAIKIVPANMANNQTLLKRFENEFRAASKLDHPNVVRALEYGVLTGRPFLVMEFVDGESLGQRLERDGKLSEEEALRIVELAAKGLQEAHEQGLIHRDIKPDNIMVTREGQVKIADLGLVKEAEADMNLTRTGRGLGTPHFMSPEQFRNAKNADVRCDIYSLGATLYMMVTGELPFKSCNGPLDAWMKKVQNDIAPPRKLVPRLSERTNKAIERSMSADPKVRQASCKEFVADLIGQGTPTKAASNHDSASNQEVWYLIYRDDEGTNHTVKGSTAGIRRSFQEGLLGDASNIRASRTKTGNFEPLLSHPEFKTLGQSDSTARSNSPVTPRHLPPVQTSAGFSSKSQVPSDAELRPRLAARVPEWLKMTLLAIVAMFVGMGVFYLINR